MPDEFIPLAEESRLILPVGDWVLEAACSQIASWAGRKETAHLTISVNISALQFRQPEFVEHVLAALERTGANPENLKLELTESMLVDNFEEVIAKMTELKVAWPELLPGRFRHRLLLAGLPQAPAPGPVEDRPRPSCATCWWT